MGRKRTTKTLDGLKRVYWMRGQWQYKSTDEDRLGGCRAWEPLGISDADARLKYVELKNSMGTMGGMNLIFDKFLVEVVAQKNSPQYRRNSQKQIERLRTVFGHMDPRLIMPKHIQLYVDKRSEATSKQARSEYSLLNQIFNRCKVWIDLVVNPCEGVQLPKPYNSSDRLPLPWEIAEVRKYAKPQWKLCIDFKFATGLDQGVIRNLTVRDILKPQIA